ncbi:MAG: signal transduction histidine kinase/integral membrane sensor domain MASE1 [Halioglobus sp.]|jgi:signal transduction histidine kinase/integral membrane sensor domain MASE1
MPNKLYLTLGIALAYATTGQLGFLFARLTEWNATFFWPPSGIALAAILLFGRQALPGIFLGSIFAGYLLGLHPVSTVFPKTLSPYLSELLGDVTFSALLIGMVISFAATLGPLTAATLMKRIAPEAPLWTHASDLLMGTVVMALACAIAGLGGMSVLYVADLVPLDKILSEAGMWWLAEFFGMLLFAPVICLAARFLQTSGDAVKPDSLIPPVILNSSFAALALSTFLYLWNSETGRILEYLEREATIAASSVTVVLEEAADDVEEVRALFFSTFGGADADQFRRFTMVGKKNRLAVPGVQGMGWAPRVTNVEVWENEMRSNGQGNVTLYERDHSGKKVAVAQGRDYFPVQFIQPLDGSNEGAIGFDLASEQNRRRALGRARDTGNFAMASSITLVQASEIEPAVLICAAVYQQNVVLDSVAARRANLIGFASAVYLIGPMFDSAPFHVTGDIDLHLIDQSQDEDPMWHHTRFSQSHSKAETREPAPTLARLREVIHGTARISFANHIWLVIAAPGPTFIESRRTMVPYFAMTAFLALGVLAGGLVIERTSARRTNELEREKTEKALLEAESANASKEYFMAAASHDIKQPLHALSILADTLSMSDPRDSSRRVLKHLRVSIEHVSKHFDDLMDFGKFEDGNFEVTLGAVSLGNFSSRIDLEIGPLCASKGLAWTLDMDDVEVLTDPELLLRLLRNLLVNAVNYTDSGEVSCYARDHGEFIELMVMDTGRGIAEEFQGLIFKRLTRVEKSWSHPAGSGLGLSIVEKINQALGLDLQMSSKLGEGTVFRLRMLPYRPVTK